MIPKVVHQIWVGGPMPAHLDVCRRTWIEHHPDWEFHLWGEADLEWVKNWDLFDRASQWTEHTGQFRSDVARYEILWRFGGVYIDCDVECLRPIDELIEGNDVVLVRENEAFIGNTVLASMPRHVLFADLVDGLPAQVERTAGRGFRPNRITGPHYVTSVATAYLGVEGVNLLPPSTFFPYAWNELDRADEPFPDSFGVHHWDNQRKLKGRPRA